MNWAYGFAAGQYRRRDEFVIAYRGTDTDDSADFIADALMVPLTEPGAEWRTMETILREYRVEPGAAVSIVGPLLLESTMRHALVRQLVRRHANRVPDQQLAQALAYFDRAESRPAFTTRRSWETCRESHR